MKKISLVMCFTFLAGCSSLNYISTSEYSNTLTENCIQSLSESKQQDKNSRKNCALQSAQKMHLAYRLYELRAEGDYKKCTEKTTNKEGAAACFSKKQDEYYKKRVSASVGK